MAVTIVLTNQKGGVGKTTSAAALTSGLAKRNSRVLAVDLDPQGNLGFSLGLDSEHSNTVYEVLKGEKPIQEAIHRSGMCDVIPSNILLSEAEIRFQTPQRELLLKKHLETVKIFYDYIIIDTPPALNILTLNAYAASDYLIIPMAAEILSLMGLTQLQETVAGVRNSVNPDLKTLGILLTKYNGRTRLAAEVLEMANVVAKQAETEVFQAKIRTGIAAAEAPAHGLSILDYAPNSNPARDYRKLLEEILEKMNRL